MLIATLDTSDPANNRWIFTDDADADYRIAVILPLAVVTSGASLTAFGAIQGVCEAMQPELFSSPP